jgi:hypothetical protein
MRQWAGVARECTGAAAVKVGAAAIINPIPSPDPSFATLFIAHALQLRPASAASGYAWRWERTPMAKVARQP